MKKANTFTKIGIFVVTALVVLMISFPYVVNASQETQNGETSLESTENKTPKKSREGKKRKSEKKTKWENLSDEEKEAKKAERKAKYENMTDASSKG